MTRCGIIAGQNAIFLDYFNYAFGESLFEEKQIADRINFINTNQFNPETDFIKIGMIKNHTWVADPTGGYRGLKLLLIYHKQFDSYSVQKLDSDVSWNFIFHNGINIERPCKAFLDGYLTRAAANLISFTTNILGFQTT